MPIHGYPGNVITANPTAPTVSSASGVWTTEQQLINQSAGRWPMAQTQVSRSLRFNSADSAYLSRTPASAGNRKTWTWSAWVKRSRLGTEETLFASGNSTSDLTFGQIVFASNDTLRVNAYSISWRITSQVFRDVSSWYHIIVAFDTTQATAANRVKVYVNGLEVTAFSTSNDPTQNTDYAINQAAQHTIGRYDSGGGGNYLSSYLAEINFIDGLALTPAYFGFNNSDTGVWSPKQYTGTYGTNGFYVNFSDNSNTTAATLGKDYSGNGNNWTPNNFSVTAGAGNDSLVDSPTSYGTDTGVGGEVRGNYCTLNPLQNGGLTLSNGNLEGTTAAGWITTFATMGVSSGKWYWEGTCTAGGQALMGITKAGATISNYVGVDANGWCYYSSATDSYKINNGTTQVYGALYTTGDIISVALDLDAGTLVFYKNGVSQGTAYSSLSGVFFPAISCINNGIWRMNFGQRAFAYTAPSGFKALCTQNLPTPTIGATSTTQANDYMNVVLWTGNGSTQNITGVGFQPDFVWAKKRSAAESHGLYDAVRGASNRLVSNSTAAAVTDAGVSAFLSDGFSISGANSGVTNDNGATYVGWNWNAGGSTVTNTSGTISAQVRASTTAGFSVVTYTGNGSGGATVGHGLGASPSWIIIKSRSNATNWMVWTDKLTTNYALEGLNTTGAEVSGGSPSKYIRAVSSTTFTIGDDISVNQSASYTYVAYCFAPVAGYSAFGSFTGNGSADGPFVFLGFRPAFVMAKLSSATGDWNMVDDMRQTYNDASGNPVLRANLNSAEEDVDTMQGQMDLLSNGFKLRSNNSSLNANGGTIIYAAFAENPFKYSLAR